MNKYFVDLHVHIGRAGKSTPVKITAARSLTVAGILDECMSKKGIDIVGIVDASSPVVQQDLMQLVDYGVLREMNGGGLRYKDRVTLIPGAEVETTEWVTDETGVSRGRSAHCLCYFPSLAHIRAFTGEISRPGRVKNPVLSSQKCNMSLQQVWEVVDSIGGIVIPAHAFTPHKGIYGSCVSSLRGILSPAAWESIPAVELGLSSDSNYADMISELAGKSFVSNSDAHSLPKIGREYNIVTMTEPTFDELVMALRRKDDRAVIGNYGFDPKLGKYHRTYCEECGFTAGATPPVTVCTRCGAKVDGRNVVMGVIDRIYQIRDNEQPVPPPHRPGYRHQIPLQNLPGIGQKTLDKLLCSYTEMEVLHMLDKSDLDRLVGPKLADLIIAAREGRLEVTAGGGGHYGRVAGRKGGQVEQ